MRLTAFSAFARVLMLLSALEPGQKLSTQKIAGADTSQSRGEGRMFLVSRVSGFDARSPEA